MIDKFDILNNETIKNIKGYINPPNSTIKSLLTYERHFSKEKIKVVEYYSNHELWTYFETETSDYFIIERGYNNDGGLFTTNVLYLNQNAMPYMIYNEVLEKDGVLNKSYRKVNSKNEYSSESFNTFLDALNYKPDIL